MNDTYDIFEDTLVREKISDQRWYNHNSGNTLTGMDIFKTARDILLEGDYLGGCQQVVKVMLDTPVAGRMLTFERTR